MEIKKPEYLLVGRQGLVDFVGEKPFAESSLNPPSKRKLAR